MLEMYNNKVKVGVFYNCLQAIIKASVLILIVAKDRVKYEYALNCIAANLVLTGKTTT